MKRSLGILAALLLALGLLVPAALAAPGAPGGARHGLVVPTDRGLVQGKSAEGIDQWLGIPYAAPPVGALRWAAPRPAPRWHGIRQATGYGGRCAQLASGNGPRVDNEDCLYLNVYAPAGHHGRLPVLAMIHGGYLWPSFNNGFSLYDLLTPAQLELSRQMVRCWGAFTASGAPEAHGQPAWPRYTSDQLMSLRPGDQTQTITAGAFGAEHQCSFWNAG